MRSILEQREVGYWVVDEAHCVSKWGHDFRPDYRYIARFIREYSGDSEPAPLICLTATAKPGVIDDICEHFDEKLGVDLKRIDGGAHRDNLSFEVMQTDKTGKLGDIVSGQGAAALGVAACHGACVPAGGRRGQPGRSSKALRTA